MSTAAATRSTCVCLGLMARIHSVGRNKYIFTNKTATYIHTYGLRYVCMPGIEKSHLVSCLA